MSFNDSQEAKLRRLCGKLLSELQFQVPDRANSGLPELEAEANRLGVVAEPPVGETRKPGHAFIVTTQTIEQFNSAP